MNYLLTLFVCVCFTLQGMQSNQVHFDFLDKQFLDANNKVVTALPQQGRVLILQVQKSLQSSVKQDVAGWIFHNGQLIKSVSGEYDSDSKWLLFGGIGNDRSRDKALLKFKIMQLLDFCTVSEMKSQFQQYSGSYKFDQEFYLRNGIFESKPGAPSDLD